MELLFFYGTLIIGVLITLKAQLSIQNNYKKYSKVKLKQDLTGQEVARRILDANGLQDIYVVEVQGELTDHYDPTRKVVRLSDGIFSKNTISAAGVAAHECGHAIQDKEGYSFMRVRSFLVPIVNLVSYLGYFGFIISLFAGVTGYIKLSIFVLLATLLFQLVTLPVEFDASRRGKEQLLALQLIDEEEYEGVSHVLKAAAMTYVASFLSNLLYLLRLLVLLGRRND